MCFCVLPANRHKKRADERTRTAFLLQLRVIGQVLQGFVNAACLEGFHFPALPCVAPYCAPSGVRVVSTAPSYRPTDHHDLVVELDLGHPGNEPEQGADDDEHDRGYGTERWRASALGPVTATSSPAIRISA